MNPNTFIRKLVSSMLNIFYFIEKEFEMLLMLKALLGVLYLLNTGDHFEQKLQPVQLRKYPILKTLF